MVFFERYFREAGVGSVSRIAILDDTRALSLCRDLEEELRELFPHAAISTAPLSELDAGYDVLVVPFSDTCAFPLEDVSYRRLGSLDELEAPMADYFLFFQADWRRAVMVPARKLGAHRRRLRIERAATRWLNRLGFLRASSPTGD